MSLTIKSSNDDDVPKIASIRPGEGDYVLEIEWEDGSRTPVDLTEPVFRLKVLKPLHRRDRFHQVAVGDWGWSVTWGDDMDLSGERLRTLAQEQADAPVPPSAFRSWLKHHRLSHQRAAELLGVSKRSVDYYATGAQPVTRTLALAMKGLELELDRTGAATSHAKQSGA